MPHIVPQVFCETLQMTGDTSLRYFSCVIGFFYASYFTKSYSEPGVFVCGRNLICEILVCGRNDLWAEHLKCEKSGNHIIFNTLFL